MKVCLSEKKGCPAIPVNSPEGRKWQAAHKVKLVESRQRPSKLTETKPKPVGKLLEVERVANTPEHRQLRSALVDLVAVLDSVGNSRELVTQLRTLRTTAEELFKVLPPVDLAVESVFKKPQSAKAFAERLGSRRR